MLTVICYLTLFAVWNVLTTWTPLSSWTNWQRTWRSSWQASRSCDFISQPSKQFNTDTYAFRHMLTHRNTYTVTGSLGPTTPWKGKSALRIPGLTQSQSSVREGQSRTMPCPEESRMGASDHNLGLLQDKITLVTVTLGRDLISQFPCLP